MKEAGGRKVQEGACIGVATMPQPWTLRLTLNAAALAATSPTLNAARLNRSASELLVCDDIPAAVKCAQSPGGPVEKAQKLAMHAGGGTNDRGEKRNVLIVSVLWLIGSNLTLRSNTQRRIQILRV